MITNIKKKTRLSNDPEQLHIRLYKINQLKSLIQEHTQ